VDEQHHRQRGRGVAVAIGIGDTQKEAKDILGSATLTNMPAARADLEAKGVEFAGETFDTGVCHMAHFQDPDGNTLMLHRRYAPHEG